MAYYLVKNNLVANTSESDGVFNESYAHMAGTVVSDWELSDHVREQIDKGVEHYRRNFEKLTDGEAKQHRIRATREVGARVSPDTQKLITPPFEDYIGLHPNQVVERMHKASREGAAHIREYERATLNRLQVMEYVAPSERAPWSGYDEAGIREVLEKMAIISEPEVQDVIAYEYEHAKRPAILSYEREAVEGYDNDDEAPQVPILPLVGATA